ncbi:Uncharacterized protein PBTT_09923 [Plasmodiophora brassicae]|uniref:Uncharacterized protein n=1 Tax=Plasmodiophora brassicae TaxID=37360 RepID=A0A0G4J0Y6_PLABS|nr:hypothetical protein PBRA_001889 [Plasmodiophora brassicae]
MRYLEAIDECVARGIKVTHLLGWTVTQAPSGDVRAWLGRYVHRRLLATSYTISFDRYDDVEMTWLMPLPGPSSDHYVARSFYNDRITRRHTEILMGRLVADVKHGRAGDDVRSLPNYHDAWQIRFIVSRVLLESPHTVVPSIPTATTFK